MKSTVLIALIVAVIIPMSAQDAGDKPWAVVLLQAGEFKPKPTGKYIGPFTEGRIEILPDRANMPHFLKLALMCDWVEESGRKVSGGGQALLAAFSPEMTERIDQSIRKSGRSYGLYELYGTGMNMKQIGFFHYASRFGVTPPNVFFFTEQPKALQNRVQCNEAEQLYRKTYPEK